MKIGKKALAAVLALALALAAGCSSKDTSWVARSGEDTIPAGVYLVELMMGYNEAASQLYGEGDILKSTIEDTPVPQYITDYAKKECANLLAIRKEFQSRGLSVGEEENQQAADYTDYLYSIGESFYQANGVEKEAVRFINDTTMMSLGLFNSIYGEGGEKAVPRADLEKEFASRYTRSQYVYFPKADLTTGSPLPQEEIDASKEKAESYLKRAQAGEKVSDLFYEVAKEQDPANAGEKMEESQYDIYLENEAGYFPPVFESTVLSAADNEVKLVEDEYYFYLIKKLPVLEGDPETIQPYLDNILQSMKYDEYTETLASWSQGMDIKYNNASLAAYTPAKLKMTQEQLDAANSAASGSESSAPESSSESAAPSESSSQG